MEIYTASEGRNGSPRGFQVLRQRGYNVGEKRAARLMKEAGLKGRVSLVAGLKPGVKRFHSQGKNILNEVQLTNAAAGASYYK